MPTMPTRTFIFLFAAGTAGLDQITMLGVAFFEDKTLGGRFMPDNAKKQPLEATIAPFSSDEILP